MGVDEDAADFGVALLLWVIWIQGIFFMLAERSQVIICESLQMSFGHLSLTGIFS